MARLHHWKFRLLLTTLLVLTVVQPLTQEYRTARVWYSLAWSVVQITTILVISETRWQHFLGLALGLPSLVGVWAHHVVSGSVRDVLELCVMGLGFVYFAVVAVMVMRHLVTHTVSADNVAGAVCAYFFLGLGVGMLYAIIETLHPHSFQASGQLLADLTDPERRRSALAYFSFITLTTAGYGDIVPTTALTRTLAALEAVMGQFYLAVLVAGLVGIRVSGRAANG